MEEILGRSLGKFVNVNYGWPLVASKIPTDAVVAICADEIGKDSLILQINETKVRIVGVHETPLLATSDLPHWCRYVILDPTPIQVTSKYDVGF